MFRDPENDGVAGKITAALLLGTSIVSVVFLFTGGMPLVGNLPLDFVISIPGRILDIPFGTSLLISAVLTGIALAFSYFSKK
jgi:hypothetical protein